MGAPPPSPTYSCTPGWMPLPACRFVRARRSQWLPACIAECVVQCYPCDLSLQGLALIAPPPLPPLAVEHSGDTLMELRYVAAVRWPRGHSGHEHSSQRCHGEGSPKARAACSFRESISMCGVACSQQRCPRECMVGALLPCLCLYLCAAFCRVP